MKEISKKIKVNKEDTKELEKTLGVTLQAKKVDDEVHGYVSYASHGGNIIAEVVLYLEDEDPTFEKYEKDGVWYTKGHKATFRKAPIDVQDIKKAGTEAVI